MSDQPESLAATGATPEPAADAAVAVEPVVVEPVVVEPVVAEPVVVEGVVPAATPHRRRRRVALALTVLFLPLLLAAGAAAGLLAWDAGYEGRILPGVRVGSVDLSGMDREGAAAALAAAYRFGDGHLVLRTPDTDLVIPYAAADRRPDVDALVDEAMAAGRGAALPDRAIAQVRQALEGMVIAPRVRFDEVALAAAVGEALATLERDAADATIAMGPGGPVTTPARAGLTVDPAPVAAAAVVALGPVEAPAELVLQVRPVALAPAVDDAVVSEADARFNRLVGDVVVTFRKKSWTIRAERVRAWVRFEALVDGSVTPVVDREPIAAALRRPTKHVAKEPVNALFLKGAGGKVVGVVASRDGRELDVAATSEKIATELEARSLGTPAATVAVATATVVPRRTTEEASKVAPVMVRLGGWTTYFPISDRNYFGANIWRPAEIIDGTVLRPGETFDWWRAIWPVTTARGFGPGGIIRSNHTDPTGALGGGMCSSSTTLFNAAMRAGLRIDARHNHRYYIDRYPLGLDATVSIVGNSRQTMSFTNDTKHSIVIRAFKIRGAGGRGYVRYQIWGIPDGRTVEIGRPMVSNVQKATTNTVSVDTLAPGVREQTEYPSNGMDVSVTRLVRSANGRIIHRDTWRTHYVRWNGRIEVGR